MDLLGAILSAVLGLVLGSFFNVIIYRLPRQESVIVPGSHCPNCGRPVRPWENVPLISYFALHGRCAGCGWKIPLSYPLVELTTAAAGLALYVFVISPALSRGITFSGIVTLVLQAAILLSMIPVAVIDFSYLVIPESITLPGIAIAALVSFLPGGITPLQCVVGALSGSAFLFFVGLLGRILFKKKETMGFGDVELLAFIGAGFGWKIAVLTIMFGTLAGLIGALVYARLEKLTKSHLIPFSPFLGIGLWIAALAGNRIVTAYFSFMDAFAR